MTVAADNETHRIILRRVFAKAVGNKRHKSALEIIGAESEMAIRAVDVAGPEGTGRMEGQNAPVGRRRRARRERP